ncbi:MAG: radical SAM protein [Thermosipho sp. (in: Bacteria)]|nr:radical SAM protein [Thermosipho sp. (in: thermotogales)]
MILRASYGTLGLLGLTKKRLAMDTAYFMLDGRCIFNCSFCSHAKFANTDNKFLSRIIWKMISLDDLKKLSDVKRVCIQVVSYHGYRDDLLKVLEYLEGYKVSVSVRALNLEEVRNYFDLGVDTVGLSIDVVNPELYREIRGGDFYKALDLIEKASKIFYGRITTHVIVGLGETDKELIDFFFKMRKLGVNVALFAFTPIRGTKLENKTPPERERYRKIQLARYLIFEKEVMEDIFVFDGNNMLKEIKYAYFEGLGKAFLTSGCSFCTRPFYNENPKNEPYNHFIYNLKLETEAKEILEG